MTQMTRMKTGGTAGIMVCEIGVLGGPPVGCGIAYTRVREDGR